MDVYEFLEIHPRRFLEQVVGEFEGGGGGEGEDVFDDFVVVEDPVDRGGFLKDEPEIFVVLEVEFGGGEYGEVLDTCVFVDFKEEFFVDKFLGRDHDDDGDLGGGGGAVGFVGEGGGVGDAGEVAQGHLVGVEEFLSCEVLGGS